MPDVIIDTNILEYAFVIPSKEEFLEIHTEQWVLTEGRRSERITSQDER